MTLFKVLGVAAFAYAVVVAAAFAMQRSLQYFPGKTLPPTPAPFTELPAETADGLTITGWYAPPAAPDKGVIVYFHGNAGTIADRTWKAASFLADGYGVLLAGYRGFGGNPGTPTEAGLIADGRAAVEAVIAQGVPRTHIVLFGESLGSGVAVQLAAADDFAGVILEAPFTSAADVGQRAYPYLPVQLLMKDRFDSVAVIDRLRAPLLVIHGERDRTTSVALGRRLFAAAPEPKTAHFLPDAGHNDLAEHGATEIERAFLHEVLGDTGQ